MMPAYTFRQLETPPDLEVSDVADVLSSAYREAEQIREQARLAGEAEGRGAGLAAIRAELEPSLQAIAGATAAIEELRDELIAEMESDAVALALRLAEQIVAGALDVQPERLVDVAALALRRIADRRHVTLAVNPADLDLMNESVLRLQSELGGVETLSVQSDRRVGRGGVLARTDDGEVDATIDAQLARAREIVADELSDDDDDEDAE
jgi:flagellar assembly protein FliH